MKKRLHRVIINLTPMSFERERVGLKMKALLRAYRRNFWKAGREETQAELLAMGMTAWVDGLSLQRAVDGRSDD